ncbi:hypothetical protein DFH06DRAFT_751224 [Mycena polygramma]|nr:hypothetical protein DFH06DRAFT_751224 [Mycena polygramma]
MRPTVLSLTLLGLSLAANATSLIIPGPDTLTPHHTPAANPVPGSWQRWFAIPENTADVNFARRSVRRHGPRRRSVHP